MNRKDLLRLSLLLFCSGYTYGNDTVSKTFLWVRPQFQFASPEFLMATRNMHETGGFHAGVSIFGGRSTAPDKLAKYFLPFGHSAVAATSAVSDNNDSLLVQNFNLFNIQYTSSLGQELLELAQQNTQQFLSTICVQPRQSIIGLGLVFDYTFHWNDTPLWITLNAPVEHINNSMNLQENIIKQGTFFDIQPLETPSNLNSKLTNMCQALSQNNWCYGKIDCCDHKKTRLAFIQAAMGGRVMKGSHCNVDFYAGVTIPTANNAKARFVFEPIVGYGKHAGIFWGSSGVYKKEFRKWDRCTFEVHYDILSQYVFKKTQKRSMDLKNKPWSRYLQVYCSKAQAAQATDLVFNNNQQIDSNDFLQSIFLATSGINVFTQNVDVIPGFNFTLNTGIRMQKEWERFAGAFEIGYSVFAKAEERVILADCCFPNEVGIKDHVGLGIANPIRNITQEKLSNEAAWLWLALNGQFPTGIKANYCENLLTVCDLDLKSAAHPAGISHTVYGDLSGTVSFRDHPIKFGIGGSYEFDDRANSMINRWLVWGHLNVGF